MPKLINYLDRLQPGRSYDEFELAALQQVYDRARRVLDMDADDLRRERLALLVFELADHASGDALLERVVAAFRQPG